MAARLQAHEREREPVVALQADGLDRGGADARGAREQLVEAAHAERARVLAVGVDERAVAHDVVGDDHAAGTRELQRELEILRRAGLVGADERRVEWPWALVDQLSEALERSADSYFYEAGEAGPFGVRAGDLRVSRLELEGDQMAVIGERHGEPDRAVAAERADLENPSCPADPRDQVQQLGLRRRERDRGQAGGVTGLQRGLQRAVVSDQQVADEIVDFIPAPLAHAAAAFRSSALISASGAARPAERRTVAIRRPGCTASRTSPTCGASAAAVRSMSCTSSASPQKRAGLSTSSRISLPSRKNAWRGAPAGVGSSRTRRRSRPAACMAATLRSKAGETATTWSIASTPLGCSGAGSRCGPVEIVVGSPSSSPSGDNASLESSRNDQASTPEPDSDSSRAPSSTSSTWPSR